MPELGFPEPNRVALIEQAVEATRAFLKETLG
jgi:hypothetical protein